MRIAGIRVRETDAVRIEATSLDEKVSSEEVSIALPGITSIVVLRWGRKGEKYTAPAREKRPVFTARNRRLCGRSRRSVRLFTDDGDGAVMNDPFVIP